MNASKLVERLKTYQSLTSLLGKDPGGEPAIYQILASQSSVWPRLEVFEENRRWTRFVDDEPAQETIRFRVDVYAKEQFLRPLDAEIWKAMALEGFRRASDEADDYWTDQGGIFGKSVSYEFVQDI